MKFRKDEWVLCFTGGRSTEISLVRVAENVYDNIESCLVHMGSFTTRYSTNSLHKLPSTMKKLIPKDEDNKILTTLL